MVGHVMRFIVGVLGACALGSALPVWALGPTAPFVAPDAAQAAAQLGQGEASGQGGAAKGVVRDPAVHKEVIEMYPPVGGQAVAAAPASTEALKP